MLAGLHFCALCATAPCTLCVCVGGGRALAPLAPTHWAQQRIREEAFAERLQRISRSRKVSKRGSQNWEQVPSSSKEKERIRAVAQAISMCCLENCCTSLKSYLIELQTHT